MSGPTHEAKAPPIPFLVPRFWLVVAQTIRMKRAHRRAEDRRYTDHLMEFYTRKKTSHVESYGDAYARVRPLVVQMANPRPGDVIVDLATGGGYQAAAFAQAGFSTIGLDFVPDRARLARENHGCSKLAWGSGDISRLPFADHSVDIVTITFALHDLPYEIQMAALAEFRRVSRRYVVIAEPRPPHRRFWRWLYEHLGELFDESLHFKEFLRRDFETHLAQSGLKVVQAQRRFRNLVAIYCCEPQNPS